MFALRVDIDTRKCLRKGVPILLDLLKKYKIKASFYIPVGGESTILELLRHRKNEPPRETIPKLTKLELLRMIIAPKNFAEENKHILKRILREGHELGVHGWKHREWSCSLDKIDVDDRFSKMVKKYESLLGRKPRSFAAPDFKTNERVLQALDEFNFIVASDLEGDEPFHPKMGKITLKHVQVPITIKGENNLPIIEYLALKRRSDEEIVNTVIKEIERRKLATFYIHPSFEVLQKLDVLENILRYVHENDIKTETFLEIAREFSS